MQKTKIALGAVIGLSSLLASVAVLPAFAQEQPGTAPDQSVMPSQSTVLPNAPKVGDSAPAQPGMAAPSDKKVEGNPDWPCIQRKVLTISPAQVWDGPPLDEAKGAASDDKADELIPFLESRRVSLDEAEKAIKEYAQSIPEGERDKKLTALFAQLLDRINADRTFVLGRIEDFQRRQHARADEIEREGRKLAEMNQAIPAEQQLGPRDTTLTPEQQEYNWNARVFQERQQNISVACEIPVLIEQRAYEIARIIRAQMSS
jgi:hypothetical protein